MNNLILATDNVHLEEDKSSFLNNAADFMQYGIVSSLTSASVGIWNTLKAGANMFGADLSMTDETEAVLHTFGRDTANYYKENKVSADFGGMLASSVVSGVGAVKAVRAWQSRGIVMDSYRKATGLMNPDIVLGSAQVQSYRAAIASKTTYSWTSKELWGVARVASTQNLLEAAAAEGVFLLTNNQNTLLNPEQLDFIDSSVRAVKEGWMFAAGGAVFGAGVDVLRAKGYAAKAFRQANETGLAQDLRLITQDMRSRTGVIGDKLAELSALEKQLNGDVRLAPTTPQEEFAFRKAQEQITLLRNDLITQANKAGMAGVVTAEQLMGMADEATMLQHLGNLQTIERVKPLSIDKNILAYERNARLPTASLELRAKLRSADTAELEDAMNELREINKARVSGNNAVLAAFNSAVSRRGTVRPNKLLDELYLFAKDDPEFAERIGRMQVGIATNRNLPTNLMNIAQRKYAAEGGIQLAGSRIHPDYAEDLVEVLTEVATKLGAAQDSYILANKFPTLTRFVQKSKVGAVEPLGASIAYYNTRTGILTASAMPRAHDIGAVSIKNGIITVEGVQNSYYYKLAATTHTDYLEQLAKFKALESDKEHPAFVASAHWAAAANSGLSNSAIHATDLPKIEVFVTTKGIDPASKIDIIASNGATVQMTQAEARQYLIQQKEISRAALQAAGRSTEEISLVLNTGEKFAAGQAADDVILMDKLDYNRAETVALRYKNYGLADVDRSARTMAGLSSRLEFEYAARQRLASDIVHGFGLQDIDKALPKERMDIIADLSQTDPRATLVTSAHTRFGSLREWAASVGSMLNKAKDTLRISTEEQMHGFFEHFSKPANFGQRAELALFTNAARTHDYYVVPLADGSGALALQKGKFQDTMRAMLPEGFDEMSQADQAAISMQLNSRLRETVLADTEAAKRLAAAKDDTAFVLSKEVAEVVQWHMKRNAQYIANDAAIAKLYGKHSVRDPDVFYAPPPSLQRQRYVAFAVPKDSSATDTPRFMLYANNQQELDAKIAYVAEHHPHYRTLKQDEVSSYKKLIGEYDKGRVFDELDFDPNLRSLGRSGNMLPNLDTYGVETLDRIRNWHHNKAEHQLMTSVEMRYADTVQTLRSTDRVMKDSGIDTAAASTIYADTVNMMLDKASQGGLFHQLYGKVQDVFNVYGSTALDVAGGKIVELWRERPTAKGSASKFDVAAFEAITKELDAKGFQNPYKDIESYLANSSNISDNRTAAALSRLANTLVAGLTLRLDPLNSVVQIISTPIMLSGVIREAKLSIAERRLVDMTTVANPVNGAREMSTAKLLQDSITFMWSKEGRELLAEARKRGILQDYTRQYIEASDFSSLNGRHTINDIQSKIDGLVDVASKATGHMFAEDFSRAWVMNAMWKIAKEAKLSDDAAWAMVRSGVDKVHGIYRAHSRVQLFNGTIGQTMGLFQSYMFNMAQNVGRAIQDGRGRDAFVIGVMQASIFGGRSLPMFNTLNNLVANTNSGKLDIYSLAGTDYDPSGMASYFLYGLGSYATVVPTDAYSRGDIAIRHSTVVPLNPLDWPSVAMIAKAAANIIDTGKAVWHAVGNDGEIGNALAYGLAHNALNRPLQGIGVTLQNVLTTQKGTPLYTNINSNNYNPAEGFNFAALGARVLGGKPLAEAIALDSYYRRTAYQTEQRNELNALAKEFRIASLDGTQLSVDAEMNFLERYIREGGNPENFNAWVGRQLVNANQSTVDVFKAGMQDTAAGRLYGTLIAERRTVPIWEDDDVIMNRAQ